MIKGKSFAKRLLFLEENKIKKKIWLFLGPEDQNFAILGGSVVIIFVWDTKKCYDVSKFHFSLDAQLGTQILNQYFWYFRLPDTQPKIQIFIWL